LRSSAAPWRRLESSSPSKPDSPAPPDRLSAPPQLEVLGDHHPETYLIKVACATYSTVRLPRLAPTQKEPYMSVTSEKFDDTRDPRYSTSGAVHVLAGEGPTTWFAGDTYTIKASRESTNGSLGRTTAWSSTARLDG